VFSVRQMASVRTTGLGVRGVQRTAGLTPVPRSLLGEEGSEVTAATADNIGTHSGTHEAHWARVQATRASTTPNVPRAGVSARGATRLDGHGTEVRSIAPETRTTRRRQYLDARAPRTHRREVVVQVCRQQPPTMVERRRHHGAATTAQCRGGPQPALLSQTDDNL
jgi:hypothetical protein